MNNMINTCTYCGIFLWSSYYFALQLAVYTDCQIFLKSVNLCKCTTWCPDVFAHKPHHALTWNFWAERCSLYAGIYNTWFVLWQAWYHYWMIQYAKPIKTPKVRAWKKPPFSHPKQVDYPSGQVSFHSHLECIMGKDWFLASQQPIKTCPLQALFKRYLSQGQAVFQVFFPSPENANSSNVYMYLP